jgi:hypothetical protein
MFGFTTDLSCITARNRAAILLSSYYHDDTNMGEEKDHKPEIIMHYNVTKSGSDILDKLVREHTCTRSTWCNLLKLFPSLNAVVSVNVFVLWMLK